MDAKATLKVGDFSRGGKKDVQVKAANHDFKAKVTPVGILLPERDELFLACVTSKVTSDRSHMILSNIVDIQQS